MHLNDMILYELGGCVQHIQTECIVIRSYVGANKGIGEGKKVTNKSYIFNHPAPPFDVQEALTPSDVLHILHSLLPTTHSNPTYL